MPGSHNMEKRLSGKYAFQAEGMIKLDQSGNGREAWGPTVPAKDATGYAKSCTFRHTDGTSANDLYYINKGDGTACEFIPFMPGLQGGFSSIDLADFREVVGNDIYSLTDTPATANGSGSLLAKNTTPVFEMKNGDTDSCLRLNWTASNSDAIVFQTALPPYFDTGSDFELHLRAAMAGTTDTPTITADTYFNEGDTKVEDASAAITGATVAEYTITVAAADVPGGAQTVTIELTPGAHTTDKLYLYAAWLEYTLVR